ncbi:hypothetical protein M422DRAFT_61667 [Sphaerobolus stellatus SS14]|uniref:Uricase n=1 Tax=Sphaerobolus stellatus (strain SS14) TaxID=990650 RepID=A0A0C9UQI3_SPHS4|nr:hypothetical protein M422DRAFT_61667 [Sphaerobolus stellatus SS14]
MALTSARYGKDLVRILRVVRHDGKEGVQDVAEYNVCALVEGAIETSFTQADNSVVVATDSIKNIVYYIAKISPHVLSPELFAAHIGVFLLSKYAHLSKAFVDVEKLKWSRIVVGEHGIAGAEEGKVKAEDGGHRHSFVRDGDEKQVVSVEVERKGEGYEVKVTSGVSDLLVLKSSGSAFTNFVRDEFTLLAEVTDRILSTSVDLSYTFPAYTLRDASELDAMETSVEFKRAAELARGITLDLFATHDSASVQATLFKMGEKLIAEHAKVQSVSYVLPNKHYIPVDMKYIGLDNMTAASAEVFMPVSAPSGRIAGTVSRK